MTHLLRLHDLGYHDRANRPVLSGINAPIAHAKRTLILGPNGAGKSTLLRLIHGLEKPTCGRIDWKIDGKNPPRRAMVFQSPILLNRSILANIEYPLKIRAMAKAERQERIHHALAITGLSALAERNAHHLSGGEKQLTCIARAIAQHPKLLLLDEPCAHLSSTSARNIEMLINQLHANGISIIMTTHNMALASRLADDILYLSDGKLLAHGSAKTTLQKIMTGSDPAMMAPCCMTPPDNAPHHGSDLSSPKLISKRFE